MRRFRLVLIAMLLLAPFAVTAMAQDVEEDVGVGPALVAAPMVYGPPVCEWGYYAYYPYACAPYGYYGPGWFYGGVFLGVGPWYGWGWGHGWGRGWGHGWGHGGYGYRGGYGVRGAAVGRGAYSGGYRGGVANGSRGYAGGARGYSGGARGYSGGARGGFSGGHAGGGGGHAGGGGGHAGGGGGHGGGHR